MIGALRMKFIRISVASTLLVFTVILLLLSLLTRAQTDRTVDRLTDAIASNDGVFPEFDPADRTGPIRGLPYGEVINEETRFSTRFFTVWLNGEGQVERINMDAVSTIQREEVELTRATIIDLSTVRVESLAGSGRTESVDTPPSVVAERERVSSEESSDVDKRADDVEEMYAARLASGKRKMEAGDFTGAKKDLSAARDAKLTEEVVRLLIACDEGAEEKRVADKKAQYEEKMAFGPYKIVRKKSNNRYGAIDARGEERIPCKYLSVGLADNGRAFEREDNLYDIYNSEGALISEGRTYY